MRKLIVLISLILLAAAPGPVLAQFMQSSPLIGPAPSQGVEVYGPNTPTPWDVVGNPYIAPNINGKQNPFGDWNATTSRDSLDSIAWKTLNVEQIMPPGYQTSWNWLCQNFTARCEFDLYGIGDSSYSISNYDAAWPGVNMASALKGVGWGNIPIYTANDYDSQGGPHAVVAILIGKSDTTFSDWAFFYGNDKNEFYRIYPGDGNMNPNMPVKISKFSYIKSVVNGEDLFGSMEMIKWNLKNGVGTLASHSNQLVIDNPKLIKLHMGQIPDSLSIDAGNLSSDVPLTPQELKNMGLNAIPAVYADSTKLSPNLSYVDMDTVKTDTSLSFKRRFYEWVQKGILKLDSTDQKVTLYNMIGPNAKIAVKNSLDSIVIDASRIPSGQELSPAFLSKIGFPSPDTSKSGTNLPIHMAWKNSPPKYSPDGSSYTSEQAIDYFLAAYGDTLRAPEILRDIKVDNIPHAPGSWAFKNMRNDSVNTYVPFSKASGDSVMYYIDAKTTGKDSIFTTSDTVLAIPSKWFGPRGMYSVTFTGVAKNPEGETPASNSIEGRVTGVKNEVPLPKDFSLSPNYPNPFNPTTTITYDISKISHVTLTVYDVLGREVAVLFNGEKSPGEYKATFNGSDLPSGVYFYRLEAGRYISTKKLVLVK